MSSVKMHVQSVHPVILVIRYCGEQMINESVGAIRQIIGDRLLKNILLVSE
jgi:hypothetical protein